MTILKWFLLAILFLTVLWLNILGFTEAPYWAQLLISAYAISKIFGPMFTIGEWSKYRKISELTVQELDLLLSNRK